MERIIKGLSLVFAFLFATALGLVAYAFADVGGEEPAPTHYADGSPDGANGLVAPEGWQTATTWEVDDCGPLPDYWDWRDIRHSPGIRNQGGCGSCWSFGITRSIEWLSKLIMPMYDQIDLAEQTLVSTCEQGGDCGGGYFSAFNYTRDKGLPKEEFDPYKAKNSSCKQGLVPERRITRWAYVGASGRGPTSKEIQCAIWKHGPVVVDVNGSFGGYKSGIFNGCGSTNTNHMVVLTGWGKGAQGALFWLMENSWGSGWGEGGRMRIVAKDSRGRNCNGIGNVTAYAVLDGVEDLREYLGL